MTEQISIEICVVGFRLEGYQQTGAGNVFRDVLNEVGLNQLGPSAPHFVYKIHITCHHPISLSYELWKRFSELV